METDSLAQLLRGRADEIPQAPFFFSKLQTWTYGQVQQTSDIVARELRLNQIQEGDRVALLLPDGPEFILAFFGILKLGAIAVPIDPRLGKEEIVHILKNCGASAALLGKRHHSSAESLLSECTSLKFTQKVEAGISKHDVLRLLSPFETKKELHFPRLEDAQAASIAYTSGRNGLPKGAVLSHRNFLFGAQGLAEAAGLTGEDKVLFCLPASHAAQLEIMASIILRGGCIVLMENFSPNEFFELAERHSCTGFCADPPVFSALLDHPESFRRAADHLKFGLCVGAPLPAELFRAAEKQLKICVLESYGLSEAAGVSSVNPPPPKTRKAGSAGLPIRNQPVKIIGEGGREVSEGEVGEITLRGENVMQGYWDGEDATAEAIKDGWLYTGDLGYRDHEGYIFIVADKKDVIIRNGKKIYPSEIEACLARHPAVKEAAVIALHDSRGGKSVTAFVVFKRNRKATAANIAAHLKKSLSTHKIPTHFEFVADFPKTAAGRTQKFRLLDEFWKNRKA